MKKAHKKRPPRATANSPPILADMGKIYFINLENQELSSAISYFSSICHKLLLICMQQHTKQQ